MHGTWGMEKTCKGPDIILQRPKEALYAGVCGAGGGGGGGGGGVTATEEMASRCQVKLRRARNE